LAGSDSFAVEFSKADRAVQWMNEYANKNKHKFESLRQGYTIETVRFGKFEVVSWKGDWNAARSIFKKASAKLNAKVLESGYHEKRDLLTAMMGGAEHAKVYSGGRLVGQLELVSESGKWKVKAEYNA
jgi:hypothetical protein